MGIYVVGMHRSGTSALAGLVSALCRLPSVRLAVPGSPQGQWERPELRPAIDLLLAWNRSTWDHPPPETTTLRAPRPLRAYGDRVLTRHARTPFLWKDPRLCLTIDHWLGRSRLEGEARVILVHREPSAVADSLRRREGWTVERGLALWERTNRNALHRLAGREVFALSHGGLVTDPDGVVDRLVPWLGHPADPTTRRRAADLIDRRTDTRDDGGGSAVTMLTDHQRELADRLGRLDGPTRLDHAPLGPESPTTGPLLGPAPPTVLARRVLRALRATPRRHPLAVAGSSAVAP